MVNKMKNNIFCIALLVLSCSLVSGLTFNDNFSLGIYQNTSFNGSAVILHGGNLSGSYLSPIFDSNNVSLWLNFTSSSFTPSVNLLYGVDGAGDIFKSLNQGLNWTQIVDNYGRTTTTGDIFSDKNYSYILTGSSKEIWRSNNGLNWSIVNNSLPNTLLIGDSDYNGTLYVVTVPGNVYRSLDFGKSWTFISDFSSATADAKGMDVNSTGAIFIVDGLGDVYSSINQGQNWTKVNDGYGGGSATDDLEIDSHDHIYILFNTQVYKSSDNGATWTVINNSVSPYPNTLSRMLIDSEDNLFVVDSIGRIFSSIDYGITWNEKGDMNLAGTNDPKGMTELLKYSNLEFQIRNCSLSDCSDGVWQFFNPTNLNLTSRYLQYRALFSSQELFLSPHILSVELISYLSDGNNGEEGNQTGNQTEDNPEIIYGGTSSGTDKEDDPNQYNIYYIPKEELTRQVLTIILMVVAFFSLIAFLIYLIIKVAK